MTTQKRYFNRHSMLKDLDIGSREGKTSAVPLLQGLEKNRFIFLNFQFVKD
jgi:hypothetical protein